MYLFASLLLLALALSSCPAAGQLDPALGRAEARALKLARGQELLEVELSMVARQEGLERRVKVLVGEPALLPPPGAPQGARALTERKLNEASLTALAPKPLGKLRRCLTLGVRRLHVSTCAAQRKNQVDGTELEAEKEKGDTEC